MHQVPLSARLKHERSQTERLISRTAGDLTLQHTESGRDLYIDGRKVSLSPFEGRILLAFLDSYGQPLATDALLTTIGEPLELDERITRHIRNLRAKLLPFGLYVIDVKHWEGYLLLFQQ